MLLKIVRSNQDCVRSRNCRAGADLPLGCATDPITTTRKRIEEASALAFPWREVVFKGFSRNRIALWLSVDRQPEVYVSVDYDRLCPGGAVRTP